MTVLVAYASAHGSTRSIAERIAAVLTEHGERVEVSAMSGVGDAGAYRAFVLGSAVHSRAWLAEATGFLRRERAVLAERPVWLFSVGMPAALRGPWRGYGPKEEALLADDLHRTLDAREHRLFSGAFRREHIPLAGRLICGLLGIRYGDYRDWPSIDAWAARIADELASGGSAPAPEPATGVAVPPSTAGAGVEGPEQESDTRRDNDDHHP
ncbi:flavodoxin domain-containing protein [Actinomadura bangladeshensis]|uniref:Flavodoxin n=1 Tax=Actinomadura bangladeshensis TaxID=453573 RepID=A0A4R4P855_9ACTN|nr:flavodoxin domain-containing protein [Actinomadura bangladeshensis]TDC18365.1 flavodoxin [Actinomadura bangladeshensis]